MKIDVVYFLHGKVPNLFCHWTIESEDFRVTTIWRVGRFSFRVGNGGFYEGRLANSALWVVRFLKDYPIGFDEVLNQVQEPRLRFGGFSEEVFDSKLHLCF
jgi:hypothetical protein